MMSYWETNNNSKPSYGTGICRVPAIAFEAINKTSGVVQMVQNE